jgi:hypothetical protein
MKIESVYFGIWIPRTKIHLYEIYDFLEEASSHLALDPEVLRENRNSLEMSNLQMGLDDLETINFDGPSGIHICIHEDGLIRGSKKFTGDLKADMNNLASYFNERLLPSLSYLFSLGAPVVNFLVNGSKEQPYFVFIKKGNEKDVGSVFSEIGAKPRFIVKNKFFEIYRVKKLYVINGLQESVPHIEEFINEQIFIKEFTEQLHNFINLHRSIWEFIDGLRERREVKGKDVRILREDIERYLKLVHMVQGRLNQMLTYIDTHEMILREDKDLAHFEDLLDFGYESLRDSLYYTKELWTTTTDYVKIVYNFFVDLEEQTTNNSISNLTVITSMGVGATVIGLFTGALPSFSWSSLGYLLAVLLIGYLSKVVVKMVYLNRKYKFDNLDKNRFK